MATSSRILKTLLITLISIIVLSCTTTKTDSINSNDTTTVVTPNKAKLPLFIKVLEQSFGHHFTIIDSNKIVWKDGDTLILDDGIPKDCKTVITSADIEDQFRTIYPTGSRMIPRDSCFDPGRARNETFFRKMYGSTKEEVQLHLDTVWWPAEDKEQVLLTSSVNGCSDSLQKVADELKSFPDSLMKFITPSSGTFNFRKIAGTERLSCHSFGIAIDINVKYSHYWRWAKEKNNVQYKNSIPYEIVEVFEKYGFIWGGYWYHYDTMHFEFRPELIQFANYQ